MLSKQKEEKASDRPPERAASYTWHLITPEYPPSLGGVADYTKQVALGLRGQGEAVHVWAPGKQQDCEQDGVVIHRLQGGMHPANLVEIERKLVALPGEQKLLVQWVPHGFGYRSMNVFFCRWIHRMSHTSSIELMIHEPFLRFWEGSWRQNVVATVHRAMLMMLLQSVQQVWVSTPDWHKSVRPWTLGRTIQFRWLPVPSNVERSSGSKDVGRVRKRLTAEGREIVGHFGTFGKGVKTLIRRAIAELLSLRPQILVLLMGAGSREFRAEWLEEYAHFEHRIVATGALDDAELSAHLSACDVLIQPFPDGVNGRRGSVMAALSHGKAVVTTAGRATEKEWSERGAVSLVGLNEQHGLCRATCQLLADPPARDALGQRALRLYDDLFDVRHTIAALLGRQSPSECESLS